MSDTLITIITMTAILVIMFMIPSVFTNSRKCNKSIG